MSTAKNSELASRYSCSIRTVQRLRRRGIDVGDIYAVASHVLDNPCPNPAMVERVSHLVREANAAEPNAWAAGWNKAHNQNQ
jgi:hypothetical protein